MITKLVLLSILELTTNALCQALPNARYGNSFQTPKESYTETFVGAGKSPESSRQDAHNSIRAAQKTIRSVITSESKKIGPNSYLTIVRIKTY